MSNVHGTWRCVCELDTAHIHVIAAHPTMCWSLPYATCTCRSELCNLAWVYLASDYPNLAVGSLWMSNVYGMWRCVCA